MASSVPVHEAEKQELSCVNVSPMLQYLENLCGTERTKEAVEPIGLPLDFLKNKNNWVSYKYYNRLLEKLVELTGDEKAPFKAPFVEKPQEIFEYILFATQAILWYGSPRLPYKIILGSNFYKRWTKIGSFEILSLSSKSMKVELTLNSGYKQTRYNCDAVQGMLASVPIGMGLPPAEVEEVQCSAEGHRSCIYTLRWQNKRNWYFTIGSLILFILLFLELAVFKNIFSFKDVILTVLSFSTIGFMLRSIQFWKNLREEEKVNIKRNEYLVETLEKIEDDYKELLDTKIRLVERTRYLSIINTVAEKIAQTSDFDTLLSVILQLLAKKLKFEKGDFFQYNWSKKSFNSLFGEPAEISEEEYRKLKTKGRYFPLEALDSASFPTFIRWIGSGKGRMLYFLPVVVPDAYQGFFCLLSDSLQEISEDLVGSLFENISDQLKAGFMKIASRTTIDNILSSIPAYVLIFHTDNYLIRYANKSFLQSFPGMDKEKNKTVVDNLLFPVLSFDKTAITNVQRNLHTSRLNERSEIFEINVGSAVLEYSIFSIPQYGEAEKLAGIILSDVTEAKSFQQKMLTSEKLLALGRVASGIAHEINNPLYAVLANAEEIAEDNKASNETRKYAEEIIEYVMNISNVIKDVSNYSKALRKENTDSVDLNAVIEESLKLVSYSSNFMEVRVEKELKPLPKILAIKGEMQQIFINLFNNAIWAMDGNGTLKIFSVFNDSTISIAVQDTGKGITDKDIPFIFNYFFTTKAPGEGTGQGLAIVERLVRMNNGNIRVKSEVGKGTNFYIDFKVENSRRG